MNVAGRHLTSHRYAGAGVAMATAATLVAVPMTASAAGITAPAVPPIVQDVSGAASALANWALASGMTFVTDPVTGLTKLVTDQLGNGATIVGAGGEFGEALLGYLEEHLVANLERAQQQIADGEFGAAWTTLATTVTGSLLTPAIGLLPLMDELGGQLGPLADGLKAATLPLILMALGPLSSAIDVPGLVLDGVAAAFTELRAGNLDAAMTSMLSTMSDANEKVIGALFGESGAIAGAAGLLPAIIAGIAGSDWASQGPFATKDGTRVAFSTVSASTPAASPTAVPSLPAFPDFGALFEQLQAGLGPVIEQFTGDGAWIPSVGDVFATMLAKVAAGNPAGGFGDVAAKAKGITLLSLLGLGMPVADFVNPYLGPIGAGLADPESQAAFIGGGNAALMLLFDTPTMALKGAQDVVTAMATGDPTKVVAALVASIEKVATFVNTNLVTPGGSPYSTGLLPALSIIGGNIADQLTGRAEPAPADDAASVAVAKESVAEKVSDTSSSSPAETPAARPDTQPTAQPVVDAEPQAPVTEAPTTEAPTTEAPAEVQEPAAEAPEAPSEEPASEAPATDVQEPATEAPAEESGAGSGEAGSGSAEAEDTGSGAGSEAAAA
ncbi:hypothetical protein [Tsukamurella sp. 1534]|uniref:hypothetical protein n=1 Tax=Tsukamurella sp. 1534 TaxID=1151061 RepID=UPI0002F8C422|nr:hypothetical protein [Tsukamurella sp. 1534]